jgi:RNA polymerase-binding protein DksA
VTDIIDTSVYRARLEEERARLANAVQFLERENPGSIADELGEIATAGENHLGDTATATYDRELDQSLEEGAQQTLKDIEAALRKIEDGSYGVCEVCGEPIGAGRLSAIPWARLCIDDQRKAGS